MKTAFLDFTIEFGITIVIDSYGNKEDMITKFLSHCVVRLSVNVSASDAFAGNIVISNYIYNDAIANAVAVLLIQESDSWKLRS